MDKLGQEWEFVNLLVEHELHMAALYGFFAESLPAERDFWAHMAKEEQGHAELIRAWQQEMPEAISLTLERFNFSSLREAIGYAKAIEAYARKHMPSHTEALGIAFDLEDSMIERKVFEFFKSGHPQIQQLLDRLEATLEDHMDALRRAQAGIAPVPR